MMVNFCQEYYHVPEDGSLSLGEILQNTAYFMFPLFLQLKLINVRSFVLEEGGGHVFRQLLEALRYKSEVRGFDSRWCHWNFSLT